MWTGGVRTHRRNTNRVLSVYELFPLIQHDAFRSDIWSALSAGQNALQNSSPPPTPSHFLQQQLIYRKSCSYVSQCSSSQICLHDKVIFPHSVCRLERNKVTALRWSPGGEKFQRSTQSGATCSAAPTVTSVVTLWSPAGWRYDRHVEDVLGDCQGVEAQPADSSDLKTKQTLVTVISILSGRIWLFKGIMA